MNSIISKFPEIIPNFMKNILFLCCFLLLGAVAFSQEVVYSEPETNDTRNLNFEIIGKMDGHFLVYKKLRSNYSITVFDEGMNIVHKNKLKFMPEKILNVNFIPYDNFAWMIYQYQKRSIVYCMAVKIDSSGNALSEPLELDTTSVGFFAENKIYSTIYSEDKNQIMVFKIQKKYDRFNFTTLLFDKELELLDKSRIETDYQDRKYVFSDFFVTNKGDFVFTAGRRSGRREYINSLYLLGKAPQEDSFRVKSLDLNDKYLDEIKLKVDNLNNHYILNSFYYSQRRGNVVGLFTAVINEDNLMNVSVTFASIKDDVRSDVKEKGKDKYALNDFFIRNVILKKSGGFILLAEDFNAESRYDPWNRYDYLYGYPGLYSPYYYNYYSPYSYGFYGNQLYNSGGRTRYNYNNIMVLSVDSTGHYVWTNVIHKTQFDEDGDNFLSYALMLTRGKLHFLFNEMERRNRLLMERTISGTGKVDRHAPMHNLDRGYDFMPRYAKQVSANEIIIPCLYRSYICFAKIEF